MRSTWPPSAKALEPHRLQTCVDKLAKAIAAGECLPELGELEILAELCEFHRLLQAAARVRSWMSHRPRTFPMYPENT